MQTHDDSVPVVQIQTVEEIQAAVREQRRIQVRGGGSKPALSTPGDSGSTLLDLASLRSILAYDPGEFTFTALAGTPVREVQAMLAEKGQYLPFDPPLAEAGATLGGVVAAGTSGPGRYRYGGVRDFLIGIRFVDGRGQLVRGGGNVVKNAAGFDFPKLMVGSLGRLGILAELTFKVFPAPEATASLRADFADLDAAVESLVRLSRSKVDLDALDLIPAERGATLWVRVGGLIAALPERLDRLAGLLHEHGLPRHIDLFGREAPTPYWTEMLTLGWSPAGHALVKVPITPKRIRTLEPDLAERNVVRRYSAGGNTAWIAWPSSLDELHALLCQHALSGLLLDGPAGRPWLGQLQGKAFLQRIAATLDPENKFGALDVWPRVPSNAESGMQGPKGAPESPYGADRPTIL